MTIPRTIRGRAAVVLLATLALSASACGSDTDRLVAGAGDLGHVHDMVVTGRGDLLVASHAGLFRVEDLERAVLVGDDRHDLMAMTLGADGELLASGHPDLRRPEYRVEGHPAHLGLATSTDDGRTWGLDDLLGEADFHALAVTADGIYGAESGGQIWHRDLDGGWTTLGSVEALDLAIDPNDPARQVATDYDGRLWSSDDGARTWAIDPDGPQLVALEWVAPGELLGSARDGTIWSARLPGEPWAELASGPDDARSEEVESFHVDRDGAWWLALHGGAIHRSTDQGERWTPAYTPPG